MSIGDVTFMYISRLVDSINQETKTVLRVLSDLKNDHRVILRHCGHPIHGVVPRQRPLLGSLLLILSHLRLGEGGEVYEDN